MGELKSSYAAQNVFGIVTEAEKDPSVVNERHKNEEWMKELDKRGDGLPASLEIQSTPDSSTAIQVPSDSPCLASNGDNDQEGLKPTTEIIDVPTLEHDKHFEMDLTSTLPEAGQKLKKSISHTETISIPSSSIEEPIKSASQRKHNIPESKSQQKKRGSDYSSAADKAFAESLLSDLIVQPKQTQGKKPLEEKKQPKRLSKQRNIPAKKIPKSSEDDEFEPEYEKKRPAIPVTNKPGKKPRLDKAIVQKKPKPITKPLLPPSSSPAKPPTEAKRQIHKKKEEAVPLQKAERFKPDAIQSDGQLLSSKRKLKDLLVHRNPPATSEMDEVTVVQSLKTKKDATSPLISSSRPALSFKQKHSYSPIKIQVSSVNNGEDVESSPTQYNQLEMIAKKIGQVRFSCIH
jgi:hypothetical protein